MIEFILGAVLSTITWVVYQRMSKPSPSIASITKQLDEIRTTIHHCGNKHDNLADKVAFLETFKRYEDERIDAYFEIAYAYKNINNRVNKTLDEYSEILQGFRREIGEGLYNNKVEKPSLVYPELTELSDRVDRLAKQLVDKAWPSLVLKEIDNDLINLFDKCSNLESLVQHMQTRTIDYQKAVTSIADTNETIFRLQQEVSGCRRDIAELVKNK